MSNDLKEYVVTLKNYSDLDAFYDDMETPGGDLYIPDRAVDVSNRRPISRNTEYWLTDEEAATVRKDPRVLAVEIPVRKNPNLILSTCWSDTAPMPKTRGSIQSQDTNWGLAAMSLSSAATDSTWGHQLGSDVSSDTLPSGAANTLRKTYTVGQLVEGRNVDVVIADGIFKTTNRYLQANADGSGGSRVNRLNWNQYVPNYATRNYNYVNAASDASSSRHGASCAGIAVGHKYGWARKANIYNILAVGTGVADTVPPDEFLDAIRGWHNSKSVNSDTGFKNPTVVNASLQLTTPFVVNIDYFLYNVIPLIAPLTTVTYRGTTYEGDPSNSYKWSYQDPADKGSIWNGVTFLKNLNFSHLQPGSEIYFTTGAISTAIQEDIKDAVNDGIIFISAAGNYTLQEVPSTDPDYDNRLTNIIFDWYYNRPNLIGDADSCIRVGAVSQYTEAYPANYSNRGTRIDIFAPGTNIVTTSDEPDSTGIPVPTTDSTYNSYGITDGWVHRSISGTSFAAPQIAGIVACLLELKPNMTPAEVKSWLISNSRKNIMASSGRDDYAYGSLHLRRSVNRYAFTPLNNITFATSISAATVNEGDTVTFTVNTTNIPDGSTLYWSLALNSTATAADFEDGLNTGKFTITNNTGSFSRKIKSDALTESATETFAYNIRTGGYTGTIQITTPTITISDTSKTGVVTRTPTYSVTTSTSSGTENINESGSVEFTLRVTNVNNNTAFNWVNLGTTTADDFVENKNSGSFNISTDSAGTGTYKLTLNLRSDFTTEGNNQPETIQIGFRLASDTINYIASSSTVFVEDTSKTVADPIYSLSIDGNPATVNEGDTISVTCTASVTGGPDIIPYEITGISAADLTRKAGQPNPSTLTGIFQLMDTSHTLKFVTKQDLSTNEGNETFTISIITSSKTTATVSRVLNTAIPGNILILGDSLSSRINPYFDYRATVSGIVANDLGRVPTLSQTQSNGQFADYDIWPEILAWNLNLYANGDSRQRNGQIINPMASRSAAINFSKVIRDNSGIVNEAYGGFQSGHFVQYGEIPSGNVAAAGGYDAIKGVIFAIGANDFLQERSIYNYFGQTGSQSSSQASAPALMLKTDSFDTGNISITRIKSRIKTVCQAFTTRKIPVFLIGMPYVGSQDFTVDYTWSYRIGVDILPYVPGVPANAIADHPMYAEIASEVSGVYLIPNLITTLYTSGNPLLNRDSGMYDVLHPNQRGHYFLAYRIMEAIQNFSGKPGIRMSFMNRVTYNTTNFNNYVPPYKTTDITPPSYVRAE